MFTRHRVDEIDSNVENQVEDTDKIYSEIVNILVVSGYFRARIVTVNAFDKVVGGLCWCIQNSGEGVDADILFEENSTIGQKIRLSERIVDGLKKMNCPIPLQPHQIQGHDFPAIKPVIVWLIKKYFETKDATSDLLRQYSMLQFSSYYVLDEIQASKPLIDLTTYYRPERKYRKTCKLSSYSEDDLVQSCLLEFGEKQRNIKNNGSFYPTLSFVKDIQLSATESNSLSSFEKKYIAAQKLAENELEKSTEERLDREKTLLEVLKDASINHEHNITTGNMVKVINLGEIQNATAAYEMTSEQMKTRFEAQGGASISWFNRRSAFQRQKKELEKQLAVQNSKIQVFQASGKKTCEELEKKIQTLEQKQAKNKNIQEQLILLKRKEENSESKEKLDQLRGLVILNETILQQETQFKENCRQQLLKLKDWKPENSDMELHRHNEIDQIYQENLIKLTQMKEQLAKKSQIISSLSRKIDDIPTKREVVQYERRFIELYDEVALKLDETRKYFGTYNTLDDTRKFIEKEVSLINSINDAFPNAMKSKTSKEIFLKKFCEIVESVKSSLEQQQDILLERMKECDSLDSKYQLLVVQQREYLKSIKDFQKECMKNEKLASQLEILMQRK